MSKKYILFLFKSGVLKRNVYKTQQSYRYKSLLYYIQKHILDHGDWQLTYSALKKINKSISMT